MATADQLTEVRNNTNTDSTDYSDIVVNGLIDASSADCASATIWKWETAKLGKEVAKGIKKSTGGVESHEFQGLKDQLEYYQGMYKYYKQE